MGQDDGSWQSGITVLAYPMLTNHPLPDRRVAAHSSIKVTHDDQFVRCSH